MRNEPFALRFWQLRDALPHLGHQGIRFHWDEIWIWKITIIVREFLDPHEKRFPGGVVPTARLLLHLFTALQDAGLTANLVSESAPDTTNRVQVFDFDFCSKFGLVFRA